MSNKNPTAERGPKRIVLIDNIFDVLHGIGLPAKLDVIPFYDVKELERWLIWMRAEEVEILNFISDSDIVETLRALDIELPERSKCKYSWQLGDLIVAVRRRGKELEAYLIDVL